jgi:hypothetical protein
MEKCPYLCRLSKLTQYAHKILIVGSPFILYLIQMLDILTTGCWWLIGVFVSQILVVSME